MRSSYVRLTTFLARQPPATTTVTLTLTEIEQLLGRPLPASAWTGGWWQVNQEHQRLRPWITAGWRVARVSMRIATPRVTFVRFTTPAAAAPGAPAQDTAAGGTA